MEFKTYYQKLMDMSQAVEEAYSQLDFPKQPYSQVKAVWESHMEAYMSCGAIDRQYVKEINAGVSAVDFLYHVDQAQGNPILTQEGIVFAVATTVAGVANKPCVPY